MKKYLSCFIFLFATLQAHTEMARHPIYRIFEPNPDIVSEYSYKMHADWNLSDFVPKKKLYNETGKTNAWHVEFEVLANLLRESKENLKKIKDGDTIFIQHPFWWDFFMSEIIDDIPVNIILITGFDGTIPYRVHYGDKCCALLKKGKIIHLFGRNIHKSKMPPNVTQLPIGVEIEFSPMKRKWTSTKVRNQIKTLRQAMKNANPTTKRNLRICCDAMTMQHYTPLEGVIPTRQEIINFLKQNDICDVMTKRVEWEQYLENKSERAFEVSPAGWGVDCYRTWEGLALGCIVLVPTSFLDPMYEDLPVIPISDWSEVTEEKLQEWLSEYGDVLNNPNYRKKLHPKYWTDKIDKVQKEYREFN